MSAPDPEVVIDWSRPPTLVEEAGRLETVLRIASPTAEDVTSSEPTELITTVHAHHPAFGTTSLQLGSEIPPKLTLAFRTKETFRLVIPGLRARLRSFTARLLCSTPGGQLMQWLVHEGFDAEDSIALPRGDRGTAEFRIQVFHLGHALQCNLLALSFSYDERQGIVTAALPKTAKLRLEVDPRPVWQGLFLQERDWAALKEPLAHPIETHAQRRRRVIELYPLRTGPYEMLFGERRIAFDLQTDLTLRLAQEPTDALRVRISHPSGLYARIGLKSGDLIIAIDQRPFLDKARTEAGLLHLRRGLPTKVLRVARGDSEFDLPFNAKTLLEDPDRGSADFQPVPR